MKNGLELGDFQTPPDLTERICKLLSSHEFEPQILIEPTCGTGNFVFSALKHFPSIKWVYCVELQEKYREIFFQKVKEANIPSSTKIEFHVDDIFTHRFSEELKSLLKDSNSQILILGNPPWVTNSEIARAGGTNVPAKSNIKKLSGIEALTGKSNFDIAEYIIVRLLQEFGSFNGKIAMLCKQSTATNIIKYLHRFKLRISRPQFFLIDSKKEFGISVSSGLFVADLAKKGDKICEIRSLYDGKLIRRFGWLDSRFVSDFDLYGKYNFLEGKFPYEWRQGVKHDASKILVLEKTADGFLNGYGEKVEVEEEVLYPFIKGSRLREHEVFETNHYIILTQRHPEDDTDTLVRYPKLWNYLKTHAKALDRRRSRVFKKRFSIFGIGDYAFRPYKVAISGFYKDPIFTLIHPIDGKPAIPDDTVYYVSFDSYETAYKLWKWLNSEDIKNFLKSIAFLDSKRPFTKEILNRIRAPEQLLDVPFQMELL